MRHRFCRVPRFSLSVKERVNGAESERSGWKLALWVFYAFVDFQAMARYWWVVGKLKVSLVRQLTAIGDRRQVSGLALCSGFLCAERGWRYSGAIARYNLP